MKRFHTFIGMVIKFHKKFLKRYGKLSVKLWQATDDRLFIFAKDPFSPILNNHALSGKYQGYRSINITGDYRAIFKELEQHAILFVIVGTHGELYR